MKRVTTTVAVLTAVFFALANPAAQAQPSHPAGRPTTLRIAGSGSGVSTTTLDSRQVGGRTLTHASSDVVFTGGITATGVEVYTVANGPSQATRLYGHGAFAGTIGDRWGTFSYRFTGIATEGGLRGVIRIDSGMDALCGVQGVLVWRGQGSSFTYAGHVRFSAERGCAVEGRADAGPVQVAGSGAGTSSTTLDTRLVGGQSLTHVISGVELKGDIVATGTEVLTVVADASGGLAFRGFGVVAGTVAGRWGLFRYVFTGTAGASGVSGIIVFDSGMEQLRCLRGAVLWSGPGATFDYAGSVRVAHGL